MLNEQAISQNKMKKFWDAMVSNNEIKRYKKYGDVKGRLAREGEEVKTMIKGEKETETTTKLGDVVITGVSGERYIIDSDVFKKRYSGMPLMKTNQNYDAKGTTFAGIWTGKDMDFINSGGEDMVINAGDYLCSPKKLADGDLYRIEKSVFPKTYK